jgi:DNA-binding MarR family transcriptional regulator
MSVDLALTRHCRCLAARKRARAITRHYEAALRGHGLRATQFSILAVLALLGPLRRGVLAEKLGLERTSLTRGAAHMLRAGWIGESRASDARERPLRITAAGRRKLEAAFPAWRAAQDAAAKKFGEGV